MGFVKGVGSFAALCLIACGLGVACHASPVVSPGGTADQVGVPVAGHWTLVPEPDIAPHPRIFESMVCDLSTGELILFGGAFAESAGASAADTTFFNDTWSYDPATNRWSELHPTGTPPSARYMAKMVYVPDREVILLYGGDDGKNTSGGSPDLGDLWEYDIQANSWVQLLPASAGPSSRIGYAVVYDPGTDGMLLFGGRGLSDSGSELCFLDDLWQYDPADNAWTELEPSGEGPAPRMESQMVYDSEGERIVLVGGLSETRELTDLWLYDSAENSWTELQPAGEEAPASRYLVYDEALASLVLVFDARPAATGESTFGMWSYNPSTNLGSALRLTGASPPLRDYTSLVYSPLRDEIMLYGGSVGILSTGVFDSPKQEPTCYGDFWVWAKD